jgi:hypothetical protein
LLKIVKFDELKTVTNKKVLILSYSYSHQTRNLLKTMVAGMEEKGVEIVWERISTIEKLRFPIGTIPSTFIMMVQTFFRKRYPVKPLSEVAFQEWDLIILAGPTWSYNPSGPVLSLLDDEGKKLFDGQTVLPLISCRGYWRMHFWGLRSLLNKCGAKDVLSPIVFSHPTPEPWRTIGVFLKLAGRTPEAGTSWFKRVYPKYGHSRKQVEKAGFVGKELGHDLQSGMELTGLSFETPIHTETA